MSKDFRLQREQVIDDELKLFSYEPVVLSSFFLIGTATFRPSLSPSPQRDYIRSGYSSGTSPERDRLSMPRHFSPSTTTYRSTSQLQDFGHYLDRSSKSPSPSPTRKSSVTFASISPATKMPPVYEEIDEQHRHRSSVTFSPSRSPARSSVSAERKIVEMQIPVR